MATVCVRWARTDAHDLLRRVVAERTGRPVADVRLHHRCLRCGGPHGQPYVELAGRSAPSVSLARSGGLAVVAVADRAVGVDVEARRDDRDLAPVALGAQEQLGMPRDPDASAEGARGSAEQPWPLRTWVRKEAVLKALGLGLTVDPSLLTLSGPGDPPRVVRWSGPGRRPGVRIVDLGGVPGHLVALAWLGRRTPVVDLARADLSG